MLTIITRLMCKWKLAGLKQKHNVYRQHCPWVIPPVLSITNFHLPPGTHWMATDQKFSSLSATTPAFRGSQSMCSRPRSSGDKGNSEYKSKDKYKDIDNDKDKAHYQAKKLRSFSTNDSSAYEKLPLVNASYFHHLHLAVGHLSLAGFLLSWLLLELFPLN